MSTKVINSVNKRLNHWIAQSKKTMEECSNALVLLKTKGENELRFRVKIISNWELDGEQSLNKIYNGPAKNALNSAKAEFKKFNNRDDIDGIIQVYVYIEKGLEVNVPLYLI